MIQFFDRLFHSSVIHNALEQFGAVSPGNFLLYAVFGIIIVVLFVVFCRITDRKIRVCDVFAGILLAVYVSVIIQLTLICRESGSRIGIDMDLFHGLLGPVNEFRTLMWTYVILNGLLFVPFGFIISMFSVVKKRKMRIRLLTVLLVSFMLSMFIECAQLITQKGYYEIQDLVVNTLGGIAGCMTHSFTCRLGRLLRNKGKRKSNAGIFNSAL